MDSISRRQWLLATGAALVLRPEDSSANSNSHSETSFHYDHQFGTSLDVWLDGATTLQTEQAEQAVLNEIERLRRIFSTYDPQSELSRFNRSHGPVPLSDELRFVLQFSDNMMANTSDALNPQVGVLVDLWNEAAATQRLPNPKQIKTVVQAIQQPCWTVDDATQTATRSSDVRLNLNSVVKGYALQRLTEVISEIVPVSGLISLGGDVIAFGERTWNIAIQNPLEPAENARPLQGLQLRQAALATSGSAMRSRLIQGQWYSHLIDPRTGYPSREIASATVLASTSYLSNTLATALAVLPLNEALHFIARLPEVECLLVTPTGQVHRSAGFPVLPVLPLREPRLFITAALANPWPKDFELNINLELPKIDNTKRYRRPYVAVWIEDAKGKPVKTLTVWGNAPKYLKDLSDWWKIGREDQPLVKAVAKATRGPGKYDLVWDGKNDQGQPVEQGTYTIRVEVHREHGKHLRQSGKIDLKDTASTLKLDKNEETGETVVDYRKKKPA